MKKDYVNIKNKEVLKEIDYYNLPNNTVAKIQPELFEIWDTEKNNKLNIKFCDITKGSREKVWWFCPKCKDSYAQRVDSKVRGSGCSICTGKVVTLANCLATTKPHLVKILKNKEDGYKCTAHSDKKLDWQCNSCNLIIENKSVKNISLYGLRCPVCSDGVSYPERVMSALLQHFKIEYSHDSCLPFSKKQKKRYDFFVPKFNLIIEMHGNQHFNSNGFESVGGCTLEEVKENDTYKKKLAIDNGIKNYIVIDSSKSNIEWLKKSILNSNLEDAIGVKLNTVNWEDIDFKATHSKKLECLRLYKNGIKDQKELAKILKVDYATVMRWLKFWSTRGDCDYAPLDTRRLIVQLDMNLNYIKTWHSESSARREFKNVFKVLSKERGHDQNYRFVYKEDYDRFIKGEIKLTFPENKVKKEVVQLTKDYVFIKKYNSIADATKENNYPNPSGISGVCNGRKKTSKGFVWMFAEDYQNFLNREE